MLIFYVPSYFAGIKNAPEGAAETAESAGPEDTQNRDPDPNDNSVFWKKLLGKVNISKLRKGN